MIGRPNIGPLRPTAKPATSLFFFFFQTRKKLKVSGNTDASAANLDEPTDERTRGRKANQGQENLIKVIKKGKKKKWKEGEKIIMTGGAKW